MHAVVVRVTIGDVETAQRGLREQVVPRVKQAPGFIAGYWTRPEDGSNGLSMVIFDSKESAEAAAEMIRSGTGVVPETVTLESVEVREVLEHASS
jgi:hypothetical protein